MKDFNALYIKYKNYLIPGIFIFLSIFIVFRVILPQISSIQQTQQDITAKTDNMSQLEQSLSAINSQNEDELTSNLEVATTALPTSKNISIIFDALSSAASDSGADMKEFSLKVGGLYGRAEKVSTTGVKGVPSVDVTVRVDGSDARAVVEFTKEIQMKLPLAEVKSIETTGATATINLSFFYKPLDLSQITNQEKVGSLTPADKKLIEELSSWSSN